MIRSVPSYLTSASVSEIFMRLTFAGSNVRTRGERLNSNTNEYVPECHSAQEVAEGQTERHLLKRGEYSIHLAYMNGT
jgi:hypothetical protein